MARPKRPAAVEERKEALSKEQENGDLRTRPIELEPMLLEYDDLAEIATFVGEGGIDIGPALKHLKPILAKICIGWTEEEIGRMPLPRIKEMLDALGKIVDITAEETDPNADGGS